jgi:hypothetical protein
MEKQENNTINHIITDTNKFLYRYDLDLPPTYWSANFKNFEYKDATLGNKNKAGLFFFTDSLDIANHLGVNAARNESRNEYHLTTVKIDTTLSLIDFSKSHRIYQMLCVLDDLKIRNLMNGFETFENEITFKKMNQLFDEIAFETDIVKKSNIITGQLKFNINFRDSLDVSIFGQRLTDFDNGIKFKKLVNDIFPKIDGYKWREFEDNRGLTYCLFNSNKLPSKTTMKIIL